jgi:hypothetical protein
MWKGEAVSSGKSVAIFAPPGAGPRLALVEATAMHKARKKRLVVLCNRIGWGLPYAVQSAVLSIPTQFPKKPI